MNLTEITPYLVAANFCLTWGIGFYAHLIGKNKTLTERMDLHTERLTKLEMSAANAPTHADLAKVYEKLNRVAESNSRMEGQLDGMDATLRLILNRMTEKGMP